MLLVFLLLAAACICFGIALSTKKKGDGTMPMGDHPVWFAGRAVELRKNQLENQEVTLNLNTVVREGILKNEHEAADLAHHRLQNLAVGDTDAAKTIAQDNLAAVIADTSSETTKALGKNHLTFLAEAGKRGITIEHFQALNAQKETIPVKVLEERKLNLEKAAQAKRLANVDVHKESELAKIAVAAALSEKLFPKHVALAFQDKVFEQVDIVEKLRRLPPSEARDTKIRIASGLLTDMVEDLNELSGKRPVPGPDGKGLERLAEKTEPPPDSSEDD